MNIITRAEARLNGAIEYFTGKACLRGHVVHRVTKTGVCKLCGAIRAKKHRAENPESVAKSRKKHRSKIDRAELISAKKWKLDHVSEVKNQRKAYYEKHKIESAEYSRQYLSLNRDKQLANMAAYRKNNLHRKAAHQQKRRATKLLATPPWFGELDEFVWVEAADLAQLRHYCTGIEWAADHMIPLQGKDVCGLHSAENCQVIPKILNQWKYNKMILTEPLEWLRRI